MAKKVMAQIKLQVTAGKATPSPPIGPALGQHGVNIMDFCKAFNARTANEAGMIIPVVITVYQDRSFTFITKTPPASVLLKKAAKIAKGAGDPKRDRVGKVTRSQVEGDCQAENGGSECQRSGGGLPYCQRHSAEYGDRGCLKHESPAFKTTCDAA